VPRSYREQQGATGSIKGYQIAPGGSKEHKQYEGIPRNNKKAFGPSWAARPNAQLPMLLCYLLKLLCIDDLTKIFNSVSIITGGSRCYWSGLSFVAWILANFNSLWNQ
jgi:hypothetical protein